MSSSHMSLAVHANELPSLHSSFRVTSIATLHTASNSDLLWGVFDPITIVEVLYSIVVFGVTLALSQVHGSYQCGSPCAAKYGMDQSGLTQAIRHGDYFSYLTMVPVRNIHHPPILGISRNHKSEKTNYDYVFNTLYIFILSDGINSWCVS